MATSMLQGSLYAGAFAVFGDIPNESRGGKTINQVVVVDLEEQPLAFELESPEVVLAVRVVVRVEAIEFSDRLENLGLRSTNKGRDPGGEDDSAAAQGLSELVIERANSVDRELRVHGVPQNLGEKGRRRRERLSGALFEEKRLSARRQQGDFGARLDEGRPARLKDPAQPQQVLVDLKDECFTPAVLGVLDAEHHRADLDRCPIPRIWRSRRGYGITLWIAGQPGQLFVQRLLNDRGKQAISGKDLSLPQLRQEIALRRRLHRESTKLQQLRGSDRHLGIHPAEPGGLGRALLGQAKDDQSRLLRRLLAVVRLLRRFAGTHRLGR